MKVIHAWATILLIGYGLICMVPFTAAWAYYFTKKTELLTIFLLWFIGFSLSAYTANVTKDKDNYRTNTGTIQDRKRTGKDRKRTAKGHKTKCIKSKVMSNTH